MVKSDKKIKLEPKVVAEEVVEEKQPVTPKLLSETALYFWTTVQDRGPQDVPPSSPKFVKDLTTTGQPFPSEFPELADVELPCVRELGIKKSIEVLGKILNCQNYAFDYLQFWFLDILTDCIWKTQDEYHLSDKEQKIVLEWVLFIFRLLADTTMNYDRKTFFKIFKETILLAADVINEGESDVPSPDKLFTLAAQEENEQEATNTSSGSSTCSKSSSTISISTYKSENIVEMELDDQRREYLVKKKLCDCSGDLPTPIPSILETAASTTNATNTETDLNTSYNESYMEEGEEEEEDFEYDDYSNFAEFHRPDVSIPKRFLPLPEESSDPSKSTPIECECDDLTSNLEEETTMTETATERNERTDEEELSSGQSTKKDSEKTFVADFQYLENVTPIDTCVESVASAVKATSAPVLAAKSSAVVKPPEPAQGMGKSAVTVASLQKSKSTIPTTEPNLSDEFKNLSDKEIMKRLKKYKLMEQRQRDMDDPKTGWTPGPEDIAIENSALEKLSAQDTSTHDDWSHLLEEDEQEDVEDHTKLIGMGVLCAIIDFVFEYFYQSFHFTLIKLATRATPQVIMQALNKEWKVPKAIKQEFQRPKPAPKKKEKKDKKDKKDKSKSSKKGSDKGSKKGKDKDKKSSKKGSDKKKGEKPKKLTKEEKAELDRQRKLQEEIEAELQRIEDNRRFMFPLTDAATDDLFMGIFENWVKPKEGKKDKGKGKGKKK